MAQLLTDVMHGVAEWIWGADPMISNPMACFDPMELIGNGACLSRLIAKGLGVAIILGSCLNKAPLYINVLSSKSVAGLSPQAFYAEVIVYSNSALYGFLQGFTITAWGENFSMLLQTLFLIYLVWTFGKSTSVTARLMLILVYLAYVAAIVQYLPESYYYTLQVSCMPFSLYSKGCQLLTAYQLNHTGSQSIVTLGLNFVGSSVRMFTTIKEVGWDQTMLLNFGMGVALNGILVIQYAIYYKKTQEFHASLQKEKKE